MQYYAEIAMCILGMSFYFNAGKLESRSGATDHSVLWASLSLLTSILTIWMSGGWLLWLMAQVALLFGIALVRVLLDGRSR